MARVITVKNWKIRRVSGNLFRLTYDITSNQFVLTGGTDTIDAKIITPKFRGIDIERIIAIFDDATIKTFKVSLIPDTVDLTLDDTIDLVDDGLNNIQTYAIGLEGAKFVSEVTIRLTIIGTAAKTVQPIIYFSILDKGESPAAPQPGTVEPNGNGDNGGGKGGRRSPFKVFILRDGKTNPLKRIISIQDSIAKAATFTGAAVNLPHCSKGIFYLDVTVGTGTSPTLDVTLEMLDPVGGDWVEFAAFTQVTGALTAPQHIPIGLGLAATGQASEDELVPMMVPLHVRAKATIGGTTPNFTYSVTFVGLP